MTYQQELWVEFLTSHVRRAAACPQVSSAYWFIIPGHHVPKLRADRERNQVTVTGSRK
jgi:hypothetical protein